jgi:hypothetical protein
MSGKLKLEMLLPRIYNLYPIWKGQVEEFCVCVCVCVCELPIVFVFYMMIEAEPTSEMCFNF